MKEASPHGVVEFIQEDDMCFKVNGHGMEHYEDGVTEKEDEGEDVICETTATIQSGNESNS